MYGIHKNIIKYLWLENLNCIKKKKNCFLI